MVIRAPRRAKEDALIKAQRDVLDRAQVLTLARNILQKNAPEIGSLAANNPKLLEEWIDELKSSREQTRRDLVMLDRVIDQLHAAQHATTFQRAA